VRRQPGPVSKKTFFEVFSSCSPAGAVFLLPEEPGERVLNIRRLACLRKDGGNMKSGKRIMVVLCLVCSLLYPGCPASASGSFLTIVTGSTGGTYYPVGIILANHFNAVLMDKGYRFSARSTAGTVENLDILGSGEAGLAISMVNLTGFAYSGTANFEGRRIENLRHVMGLWQDVTQFVVRSASGIRTWPDLKGKRIAVGPAGSGTEFSSMVLLKVLSGLSFSDIAAERVGYSEASQALRDGRLDAFNAEAGFPVSAVAESYAGTEGVAILEISPMEFEKLHKEAPFYREVIIPAGTYPNQKRELRVAGIKCCLLAGKDVPEELVYNMLKVIYSVKDELKEEHAAFTRVDFDNPLEGLFGPPLHPGAVKFFREMGLSIPRELIP